MNITDQAINRVQNSETLNEIDTLGSASLLTTVKGLMTDKQLDSVVQSIRLKRREILGNTSRVIPGSAWDTWRNAGSKYAGDNPQAEDHDISHAAALFAKSNGLNREVVKRAFLEGAYSVND